MKISLQSSPFNRSDLFEAAGFEVTENVWRSEEDMIDMMQDADGAQVGVWPATSRKVLEACPKLKVVSRMGVGVDSIDLDAATELGVLVCNVPGINTAEVAEHAIAMLLALTRRICDATGTTKDGAWRTDKKLTVEYMRTVRRIAGHTIGVIGFGNIGQAFATRMRSFGPSRIIAYDPFVPQTVADLLGVKLVSLEELLTESDYVSIHTSLTTETRHLINEKTLKLMKPTAMLVNTSRGPVIDGQALFCALQEKTIEAAALDVTEVEPIESADPLLSLSNVIITPHLAGFSPTFLNECPVRQAENVIRVLTGSAPWGLANPEAIKTIAIMRNHEDLRWRDVPDFKTSINL